MVKGTALSTPEKGFLFAGTNIGRLFQRYKGKFPRFSGGEISGTYKPNTTVKALGIGPYGSKIVVSCAFILQVKN